MGINGCYWTHQRCANECKKCCKDCDNHCNKVCGAYTNNVDKPEINPTPSKST